MLKLLIYFILLAPHSLSKALVELAVTECSQYWSERLNVFCHRWCQSEGNLLTNCVFLVTGISVSVLSVVFVIGEVSITSMYKKIIYLSLFNIAYSFISKNVRAGVIVIDNIKKILLNILFHLNHIWSICVNVWENSNLLLCMTAVQCTLSQEPPPMRCLKYIFSWQLLPQLSSFRGGHNSSGDSLLS